MFHTVNLSEAGDMAFFADVVDQALATTGFLIIIDDIDNSMDGAMQSLYQDIAVFFDQPSEYKQCFAVPGGQAGYVARSNKDNKEYYHFPLAQTLHRAPAAEDYPDYPSMAVESSLNVVLQVRLLSVMHTVRKALEILLHVPISYDETLLRLIHYPAGSGSAAPHTDSDLFTILPPSEVGGLEVLVAGGGGEEGAIHGRWHPIPSRGEIPGPFYVVNAGDMLQSLSGGRYHSAIHRVTVSGDTPRLSMAMFVHPAKTMNVAPVGSGRVVTQEEMLREIRTGISQRGRSLRPRL